jgi:hypothetical protein
MNIIREHGLWPEKGLRADCHPKYRSDGVIAFCFCNPTLAEDPT